MFRRARIFLAIRLAWRLGELSWQGFVIRVGWGVLRNNMSLIVFILLEFENLSDLLKVLVLFLLD
jgi:hypothetical protein